MFTPTVIELLNTEPRACLTVLFVSNKLLLVSFQRQIRFTVTIASLFGVDVAWSFLNQPISFCRIVMLGKKKGKNRVVPIENQVPLARKDGNVLDSELSQHFTTLKRSLLPKFHRFCLHGRLFDPSERLLTCTPLVYVLH